MEQGQLKKSNVLNLHIAVGGKSRDAIEDLSE
jgi:hypothetical protein